jgi:hypothetical protein
VVYASRRVKDIRNSKDRAWREVAAIDAAYARGEIDDEGWHRAMAELVVPAYLAGDVRRGSGHTGTAEDWEYSRGIVGELVELVALVTREGRMRDGERADGGGRGGPRDRARLTFLDVGCANGLLMESLGRWCPSVDVEPYGLEISAELAARARERLPQWSERIFVGNALAWEAPMRFDIVRTGLEYVPRPRRRALVEHLLGMADVVIVGKLNEEIEERAQEAELRAWGFDVVRSVERPHRADPRICYRAIALRG